MKEARETLVQSKFSAKSMKKIQKAQGELKAQGKPASQRSDDMEEIYYQQSAVENTKDFIKRLYAASLFVPKP